MSAPDLAPDEAAVVAAVTRWLERAVIGLNLCPFARAPHVNNRLRIHVSPATTGEALLIDLHDELRFLAAADPAQWQTTLLVHPGVFTDFLPFNDFQDQADALLRGLDLEGVLQIASFHPQFLFADAGPDDVSHCSNRSPYPILHLLREDDISRAVDALADPDAIYRRNIATLRRLGHDGWRALWHDEVAGP